MRLKDLEIALQSIERTNDYDIQLEQYPTPANIVSSILFSAQMDHQDITDRVVLDLGCGDGIFALGAALLGARRVIGIDVQSKALKASQMNSRLLGIEDTVDWILGEVSSLQLQCLVDTVVSNPPFGVKKRGADMRFLTKAISVADVTYSIHLAGEKNRTFLTKEIEKLGAQVTQIETFQFPIKKLFDHHKKEIHLVDVDLYRIRSKESEQNG
ncbi:methyltransferase domain-containing protein [Candidatus Thorarchaeota archaeon]|nr:MAG: methyltransferase domain-containing protein [Candidatus Thorarchaeota archaeon]